VAIFGEPFVVVDRRQIRKFSRAVAQKFRPQKIILFCSYAYGTPTEDSDVDLLVILPRTRERGERMSLRIRHAVPRTFPLDLLVRTPGEVAKRLRWGDSFLREVVEKGKVLYEASNA
jgi:predicted nucleotidyltransferase